MENPVRKLRELLGLNQSHFADLIGRSFASVQGYESGKRLPPDIAEKMRLIALENGDKELALMFSGERRPDKAEPRSQPPAARGPGLDNWHTMLDEILDSGNARAISAVQSNLIVFSDYVEKGDPPWSRERSSKRK